MPAMPMQRLTAVFDPALQTDEMPWMDASGAVVARLWQHQAVWSCAEGLRLAFRILAAEPLAVPPVEPGEPAISALARLVQSVRGSGALVMLDHPAEVFTVDRVHGAEGVRLFGITDEADVAAWDALLAMGQPVYGIRDRLTIEILRPHPASILSALAYGTFTCDDGLVLTGLQEDRAGIAWSSDCATTATAVIRDGFEAGTIRTAAGAIGKRADGVGELVVRLVIRDDQGHSCWTQPRFVSGTATSGGGCAS